MRFLVIRTNSVEVIKLGLSAHKYSETIKNSHSLRNLFSQVPI